MAQEAALNSAFSARPSALGSPVPGGNAQASFDDLLAKAEIKPTGQQAPAASEAQGGQPDQLASAEVQQPQAQEQFPIKEPSSFMGINTDLKQQLEDMPTRIRANLAGDPESVRLTLEKNLGKENVKIRGKTLYFKNPGDKAFRELDPSTFEVVNDLFSDFYKEAIQTMGGVAGGVTGAVAGPAGAFGGAALGAAAGTHAANVIGEQFGVEKAPGAAKMGLNAPYAAEITAEGAMFAAADGAFKLLGSKIASMRAKTQGLRTLSEVSPMDRLQESVKTNLETLQEMKNLDLVQPIAGTNIEIPAHQLLPHIPNVEKIANSVAAEKSFQQAQKAAAENFGDATLGLVEEAAGITRGKLSEIMKEGVPLAKETTAADINGLFNKVRKAEGSLIGEYRDKARAVAGKQALPTPKTAEALQGIFQDLGVKNQEGKLVFPQDDSLAQVLGTDSQPFINGLKADLTQLNNKLVKGGFNIDELLGQSQIIGAKNEGARRVGGLYKATIGKLSSAIRSDSREAMPILLDSADALDYNAKMNRFSSISNSMQQLDSYLNDDIGMNTFAKGLVNKGKEGITNLRAAKEFLLQENPAMYKDLISQYMEELALKHRDPTKVAGFNPTGMRKELASLGSEYLDELFPAKGAINKNLVLRSFDLAAQVQNSVIGGTDSELIKDARKAVASLSMYHRAVNATYALVNFGTKDNRLLKLLSKEGVESFLEETPKKNREDMRQTLNAILQIARQTGTLKTINTFQPTSMKDQIKQVGQGTPVGP